MSNVLLYGKNGRTSCAGIVAKMEDILLIRKRMDRPYRPQLPNNVDVLIRWANPAGNIPAGKEYQKGAGISLAYDKKAARVMLDFSGVPVPKMMSGFNMTFPVIGRPRHHRAGVGFFLCNSFADVAAAKERGAEYFCRVYPKTREFRVHVGHGYVLLLSEKVMPENYEGHIFNHENGAYFRRVRWSEWPIGAVEIAVKAVKALGLDYGAVDVMGYPTDLNFPPFVVTEVNTSPSLLSDYNVTLYAEYFSWLLKDQPDWVDLDVDRPQDFAFRKYHGREQ